MTRLHMALEPLFRMGPPPRSFAADAHDCIMVPIRMDQPNTRLWREAPRRMASSPRIVCSLPPGCKLSQLGSSWPISARLQPAPIIGAQTRKSALTENAPYKCKISLATLTDSPPFAHAYQLGTFVGAACAVHTTGVHR